MNDVRSSRAWEKVTLFAFGTAFFTVLIAIALLDKHPSKSSWYVYTCVLAMAAGGVGALLPGAINVNLHPGIRAGGAIAIFVLVFFYGKDKVTEETIVQGLKSHLDSPNGGAIDPSSDVYVVVNSKLAAYGKGGLGAEDLNFGTNDWKGTKKASVERGAGGIQIVYGSLAQGDTIDIIAKDRSNDWWISNDMTVPEGELGMRMTSLAEVKRRFADGP